MVTGGALTNVPIDPAAWGLDPGDAVLETHLGRRCLAFADVIRQPTVPGVQLADGVIDADVAVSAERSFHGVVWHHRARGTFEQFFVRPHQAGNPDAVQYTPVTNGVSSWQLYHGPGFWAPIRFPIDAWFTIRVEVQGARADIFVADLAAPALRVAELKLGCGSGGVGLQVGGPGLCVARFAHGAVAPPLARVPPPEPPDGTLIAAWGVSDPFPEALIIGAGVLPEDLIRSRHWDRLVVERSGLADLARLHEPREAANTVLVRAIIEAVAPRSSWPWSS